MFGLAFIFSVMIFGAIGAIVLGDRLHQATGNPRLMYIGGAVAFVFIFIVISGIMTHAGCATLGTQIECYNDFTR